MRYGLRKFEGHRVILIYVPHFKVPYLDCNGTIQTSAWVPLPSLLSQCIPDVFMWNMASAFPRFRYPMWIGQRLSRCSSILTQASIAPVFSQFSANPAWFHDNLNNVVNAFLTMRWCSILLNIAIEKFTETECFLAFQSLVAILSASPISFVWLLFNFCSADRWTHSKRRQYLWKSLMSKFLCWYLLEVCVGVEC